MRNEKLGKLLQAAEKYGAEAAYEMAVELQVPGVESGTTASESSEIAEFINKGTVASSKAKGRRQLRGTLTVNPFTNLPL